MIQFTVGPIMEIEANNRHQDKIKEAELYRLINELRHADNQPAQKKYPILGMIGKKLVELGSSLEERHSTQSESSDETLWLSYSGSKSR